MVNYPFRWCSAHPMTGKACGGARESLLTQARRNEVVSRVVLVIGDAHRHSQAHVARQGQAFAHAPTRA